MEQDRFPAAAFVQSWRVGPPPPMNATVASVCSKARHRHACQVQMVDSAAVSPSGSDGYSASNISMSGRRQQLGTVSTTARSATQAVRSASIGRAASAQEKRKVSHWLGKKHREESKHKISMANKGNVPWNKGLKHSDETRRKIAERTREAMLRPEMRERMRQVQYGRYHDDVTKEKISTRLRQKKIMSSIQKFSVQSEDEHDTTKDEQSLELRQPNRSLKKRTPAVLRVSPAKKARATRGDPLPFVYPSEMVERLNSFINQRLQDPEFVAYLQMEADIDRKRSATGAGQGRKLSEKTKQKLSSRIRSMWQDPEYRQRVLDGMKQTVGDRNRRPLSSVHRQRISESLLLYNGSRRDDSLMSASARSRLSQRERERALEERARQRDEARRRHRQERRRSRQKNRAREHVRSKNDRSLVQVLQEQGVLPEPSTPGIIDTSGLHVSLADLTLPEIHLDFDSRGDHITTIEYMQKTRRRARSRVSRGAARSDAAEEDVGSDDSHVYRGEDKPGAEDLAVDGLGLGMEDSWEDDDVEDLFDDDSDDFDDDDDDFDDDDEDEDDDDFLDDGDDEEWYYEDEVDSEFVAGREDNFVDEQRADPDAVVNNDGIHIGAGGTSTDGKIFDELGGGTMTTSARVELRESALVYSIGRSPAYGDSRVEDAS